MVKALPPSSSDVAVADPLFKKRIVFRKGMESHSRYSSSNLKSLELNTLNPSTSMNQRSPAAVKTLAQVAGKRAAAGADSVFSFSINLRRIGAGLQNLGNTCYLNSVLQCLTYTEPFAAYCHSGHHKNSCRAAGFCVMCALQNHVTNALQASGRILAPHYIVRNLRCISRNFRTKRQEDAHEYMVNLLESIHKCCLPSGIPTESPNAYEKSLVHKIFGGRLRSQVKCTQCGYCSNKYDPFLDLSLELYKVDSLIKALRHFTAAEQLDGGERQYQCQRCKVKVRANKQLTIHNAPYVLSIHLKRFGPTNHGKIDKRVDFDLSLNLKPFISDQQGSDLKYTLYGVLVHDGYSTHSGHYYCFVRTSSGLWHRLDDNQVRPVSEKAVLSEKAYMLFYVRDKRSVLKRSADVRRDNIIANSSKCLAIMQPIVSGKLQIAEKKICTSESKPVGNSHVQPLSTDKFRKSRDDAPRVNAVRENNESICNTSQVQPMSIDKFSKSRDDAPKVNAVTKNNESILTEKTSLQTNNQVTPNGLQQALSHNNHEKYDIKHEESIPEMHKLQNSVITTGSKAPTIEIVCDRDVTVVDKKNKVSKKLKLKLKKMGKTHHYFGLKQLLFASLSVRRKRKKCKKQCLKFKNIVKDKILAQDAVSVCASLKDSHSRVNKELENKDAKYDINCNGELVYDRKFSSCSNNKAVLTISYQSQINDTSMVENNCSQLKCFEQTTVPRWEDEEMPDVQSQDRDDAMRNEGVSLYDIWDEAPDQGKKKKIKKSKCFLKRAYNRFMEASNEQSQQRKRRKMYHKSFHNQQLRL